MTTTHLPGCPKADHYCVKCNGGNAFSNCTCPQPGPCTCGQPGAEVVHKIYLASSWRNPEQPCAVEILRNAGHEVYDFRNPPGGIENGFRWSEIDPDWDNWTAERYREGLKHPLAKQGFNSDFDGMKWANVGVLLLPCGRSAHLELGWMAGAGKRTIVLTKDGQEPELMALLATEICVSMEEVIRSLAGDK